MTRMVLFGVCLIFYLALEVEGVSVEEDMTFTHEEQLALNKFRPRVFPHLPHGYMKTDIYLIRWLRARNLNVNLAERMLLRNLRWRLRNRMDSIMSEDWDDMRPNYPFTSNTFDKEGRPIGTISFGQWDVRKILLEGKMPRYMRYLNLMLETAYQAIIKERSEGKNVTQCKVLLNIEGFSDMKHSCPICMTTYKGFVHSYELHYPGYADQIILINTPPAYHTILDFVRPLFSPATQKAVVVFGEDKEEWNAYLDKEIEKEQRTEEFGGTKS